MTITRIITALFEGFAVALRASGAALAVIIIIRSLAERFSGNSCSDGLERLVHYTEAFVAPVRTMIPSAVAKKKLDYSLLVSALMVLLLGLGAGVFFETVAELLSGLN